MELLFDILKVLFGLIVGGVIGFFVARNYMQKYFKKNPPINEQMIKMMMQQMGRTPRIYINTPRIRKIKIIT